MASGQGTTAQPCCHAPFTSMHLDPMGNVRVCELNSMAMLGNVADARLPDLWDGATNARIRAALLDGDLSLGCEACVAPLATDRSAAHAAYYDQFALDGTVPAWPRQLELSLSNACNLQCVMCNGDLSSAIRAHREHLPPLPQVYDDRFFDDLVPFLPHLERVAFIGGEPFLGRESLRVLDLLTALPSPPLVNVTTNGTVLNDRVRGYLRHLPVDVSVSVDALTPETYAAIRVGGDFAQVQANIDELARLATSASLSFCLMTVNWHEFGGFLRDAERRGLPAHVNVVTAPRRFSLYHLPPADLARVLDGLEADAAAHPDALSVNAPVWHRQVARLRSHLATLSGTPVTVGARSGGAHEIARRAADARGTVAIDLGPSEEIVAVRPDAADALGMDLRPVLGGHLTSLVATLRRSFGELTSTGLRYHDGGIEERTMSFDRGGDHTELLAVLGAPSEGAPPDATSSWYLAARAADPS